MAITAPAYQSRHCATKVKIDGFLQILILTPLILVTQTTDAQTYTVLHRFTHADGGFSTGPLIQDDKGNFYGTTQIGRTSAEYGTVFKLNQQGAVIVLHTFTGKKDGGWPGEGVVRDAAGNFYGTTMTGGDPTCKLLQYYHGCGIIFKLTAAGSSVFYIPSLTKVRTEPSRARAEPCFSMAAISLGLHTWEDATARERFSRSARLVVSPLYLALARHSTRDRPPQACS